MRFLKNCLCWAPAIALLFVGTALRAIETTTELGITITADQVIESMLEMEGFWPPVRTYIASDRFRAADAATREETVSLLKQLSKMLSARLASDDDEVGEDLARYMAARLRKHECYRQLRALFEDDALTIRLKNTWEAGIDACQCEPGIEREQQVRALLERIAAEMAAAGVSPDKRESAKNLWERLAQAKICIYQTDAGLAIRDFELEVEETRDERAKLLFAVLDATEWALIAKPSTTNVTRQDFVAAWEAIDKVKLADADGKAGGR